MAPRGDGHPVIVFPIASPATWRRVRFAGSCDVAVMRSAVGDLGLTLVHAPALSAACLILSASLTRSIAARSAWSAESLGGIYARQLAKLLPDRVRSVLTLGSPFASSPKSTNAWRLYEMVSGQSVHQPGRPVRRTDFASPPVPTTAIFSRTDGICAWQACIEQPSASVENIEVDGSHTGLTYNPAVAYAIPDRLAQREDEWKAFHRNGWRSIVYPNSNRSWSIRSASGFSLPVADCLRRSSSHCAIWIGDGVTPRQWSLRASLVSFRLKAMGTL